MRIEEPDDRRLVEVAGWLAERQDDPRWHIAYLSSSREAVAAELADLALLVAVDDQGALVGAVGADTDVDPPRVWWYGPAVRAPEGLAAGGVADALYTQLRRRLPRAVTQEEFALDDRAGEMASFVTRHGFVSEEASAVLRRDLAGMTPSPPGDVVLREPEGGERQAAARLHDALFPGTHSTGAHALRAQSGRAVLVAVQADAVVGYAVAEAQADAQGYLDFLGVSPAARAAGVGRALATAVAVRLRDRHGCRSVHLTVRESNAAARRLYAGLGFQDERILRPWRKGFTLADAGV